MHNPGRVTFRGTAVGLICCAIVVAFLNLYMNFLASRNSSSFQIDLSAGGDVLAFHQFDFPGGGAKTDGTDRRRRHQPTNAKSNRKHFDHDHHSASDSCMGLCPGPGSLLTQADYVKTLIHTRMKRLASNAFVVEMDKSEFGKGYASPKSLFNASYLEIFWRRAADWVSSRNIRAPDDMAYSNLTSALNTARIIRAATPTKGTQLKAMVLLDGGQWAVWKPKFLERSDVVEGEPTDGPDRHNGEIAAFYIGHMLGLDRTPFVSGRIINIRSELHEVADKPLRDTFFIHNQTKRFCFYGKCMYCKPSLAACGDERDRLEGALVLWLPSPFSNLTRIRSPWARTYDQNRLAAWQVNTSFCRAVFSHELFGKSPIFLDLMETAVFDFLIGNADRHRLEFFKDRDPKSILLLDNGKSFGNPKVDELTILAPLYQCCRLRQRLYQLLVRYSEINFGDLLNDRYLRQDPLYPVLTGTHLEAIGRRLRKVLSVLASCMEVHGPDTVLVDDGY